MFYTLFKNLLFRPVIKFLYGARVENEANIPAMTGGVILASNYLERRRHRRAAGHGEAPGDLSGQG